MVAQQNCTANEYNKNYELINYEFLITPELSTVSHSWWALFFSLFIPLSYLFLFYHTLYYTTYFEYISLEPKHFILFHFIIVDSSLFSFLAFEVAQSKAWIQWISFEQGFKKFKEVLRRTMLWDAHASISDKTHGYIVQSLAIYTHTNLKKEARKTRRL